MIWNTIKKWNIKNDNDIENSKIVFLDENDKVITEVKLPVIVGNFVSNMIDMETDIENSYKNSKQGDSNENI